MLRIGVLASRSGTLLESIVSAELPVTVVLADRSCRALEVAERHGVPSKLVARPSFGPDFDRLAYTEDVVDVLRDHGVELVVMAGWGTVFENPIFDAYPNRMLLTHPALLPAFRGWHPVRDALEYGVKLSGCTVLVATIDVDSGPILAQEAVPVLSDDTEERLHERIKAVERRLYPETIKAFIAQVEDGSA